jgi:tetratricopeptide (TPR) repeat protein
MFRMVPEEMCRSSVPVRRWNSSGAGGCQTCSCPSVEAGRDAVATTEPDHPNRARYLSNLSSSLHALYRSTGETALLVEAAGAIRAAVASTPTDHPSHAAYVGNLSSTLRTLSARTGDIAVLAEAVQVGRDALAATPADHPARAIRAGNLLNVLRTMYERTGETSFLADAVGTGRDAVAATELADPARAARLSDLGGALRTLSARTGDMALLAESVQAARDALSAAPAKHPAHAGCLLNLGLTLQQMYKRTGQAAALAQAEESFAQAGSATSADIPLRIAAWRVAAVLASQAGRVQQALTAAEAAVALLPRLTPHSLDQVDREQRLGEEGSLAGVAAAAAVAAGRLDRAVELLERTRGVLVSDSLEARSSDLTRLRQCAPGLAAEFEDLRERRDILGREAGNLLDEPDGRRPQQAQQSARYLSQARRDADTGWTDLIARIHCVEGLDDFLATPSINQLAAHTCDGPVIFVYTSQARGDALIVGADPTNRVRLVPLPMLTPTAASQNADQLIAASQAATDSASSRETRLSAERDILQIPAWLWDAITSPVLTELGYTGSPGNDKPWPRVYWCPVGVIAYLPLHAAGHHAGPASTRTGGAGPEMAL